MLTDQGFTVLTAEDGEGAVAIYRDRRAQIDVVLLDLTMPGPSGEETFAQLRALDAAVRVILTSGHSRSDAAPHAAPAAFLQKPYRREQLLAEIDRCLALRSAEPTHPGT